LPNVQPCFQKDYDWGSPVVPTNPRGFYRTLWQAQDALGKPRSYPANLMQCAGRQIRKDYMYGGELYLGLSFLLNSPFTAPCTNYTVAGITYAQLAIALVHAGVVCSPYQWKWWWGTYTDPTYPARHIAIMLEVRPITTWYRLTDMASWPFGSAPFEGLYMGTAGWVMSESDYFGSPWLNPI
jgi:hypothetical protein